MLCSEALLIKSHPDYLKWRNNCFLAKVKAAGSKDSIQNASYWEFENLGFLAYDEERQKSHSL